MKIFHSGAWSLGSNTALLAWFLGLAALIFLGSAPDKRWPLWAYVLDKLRIAPARNLLHTVLPLSSILLVLMVGLTFSFMEHTRQEQLLADRPELIQLIDAIDLEHESDFQALEEQFGLLSKQRLKELKTLCKHYKELQRAVDRANALQSAYSWGRVRITMAGIVGALLSYWASDAIGSLLLGHPRVFVSLFGTSVFMGVVNLWSSLSNEDLDYDEQLTPRERAQLAVDKHLRAERTAQSLKLQAGKLLKEAEEHEKKELAAQEEG